MLWGWRKNGLETHKKSDLPARKVGCCGRRRLSPRRRRENCCNDQPPPLTPEAAQPIRPLLPPVLVYYTGQRQYDHTTTTITSATTSAAATGVDSTTTTFVWSRLPVAPKRRSGCCGDDTNGAHQTSLATVPRRSDRCHVTLTVLLCTMYATL